MISQHDCIEGKSMQAHRRSKSRRARPTAFDWVAYSSRCSSLRLLRRNKVHVDTLIRTHDGYTESAHWQVFSVSCPNLVEASRVIKDDSLSGHTWNVYLPETISCDMARLLIECAYGEQPLSIGRSNLEEFYQICDRYRIDHGIDACLKFAKKILDTDNCVYMFQLASKHNHLKLKHAAYSMIRSNFKLIVSVNRDFHKLEFGHLKRLLRDDLLSLEDDEEIGWLTILRWLGKRPMTQAKMASLYNQMVTGPQDLQINIFQHNNSALQQRQSQAPSQQQQLRGNQRRQSMGEQTLQQVPIRVQFNLYSPGQSIGAHHRRAQALSDKEAAAVALPLRSFVVRSNIAHSSDRASATAGEEELAILIKSLRFMRFKSVSAFETIMSHPLVAKSEALTSLLICMRVRYKLRHKISLTHEDKQAISQEHLAQLRYQELSRPKRALKRLTDMVGLHQGSSQGHLFGDSFSSRLKLPSRFSVRQVAAGGAERVIESVSRQTLGPQSVERASRPRAPASIGLLFGGWQDGTISKTIWAYDFIYDRWFKLNIKLPEPRALHVSCASPTTGHVYIFGGTNGSQILNSVWRFNPASDIQKAKLNLTKRSGKKRVTKRSKLLTRLIKSKDGNGIGATLGGHAERDPRKELKFAYRLKQLCDMNEQRCHLSGVFHSDGRLYALGGHNGNQRLRSAEWYDTQSNQWHLIAEMAIARSDAAACSHEDKIFIAGGQISDQFIQSSVEFYKSSDNTWTFAVPMIIPRMSFRLASYKGQLLALGGTNGLVGGGEEPASVTRSVERFNSQSGSWTFCAPMAQKRCSFDTMHIGGKLIVVGGYGGSRRLKSCETLRIGRISAIQNAASDTSMGSPLDGRAGNAFASSSRVSTTTTTTTIQRQPLPTQPTVEINQRSNSIGAANFNHPITQDLARPFSSNQLNFRLFEGVRSAADHHHHQPANLRSATKWVRRSDMPERRSGFSIAVVNQLRNAIDYTYFGSVKHQRRPGGKSRCSSAAAAAAATPCLVRQASRWKTFKVIKRRKLVKHLKIALVVSIVILIM